MTAVLGLLAYAGWTPAARPAAAMDTAAANTAAATGAPAPAPLPAIDLARLFGPTSSLRMTPAPASDQLGKRVPATVCEESFCSTNAQCTCPGSTCVDHVCSAGSGGGGGGGGGGGPCVHSFCATNAGCTCAAYPECIDNICQE